MHKDLRYLMGNEADMHLIDVGFRCGRLRGLISDIDSTEQRAQ